MDARRSKTTDDPRTHCDTPAWTRRRRTLAFVGHQRRGEHVRSNHARRRVCHRRSQLDPCSTHRSVVLLDGEPILTDEIGLLHRLQITNNDVFQKPRSRCSTTRIVMPDTNVIQWSQRSTKISIEHSCVGRTDASHFGTLMTNASMPPRAKMGR